MNKIITEYLTNSFNPDVRVYKEAKYLISKGYKVRILCWDRSPNSALPQREIVDGIEVIRFNIPSKIGTKIKQLKAFFKYISCCKKFNKKHKTDYFHCNDIDGAIAWLLSKKSRSPMVFDMHELYEDVGRPKGFKKLFWRKVTIAMIKKSKAALYENDLYLRNNYASVRGKLYPLKNYPPQDLFDKCVKTESPIFRIGYFGAVRGQLLEFETLFEATKGMKDVRIDIYGSGPDYHNVCEKSRAYDNVIMHGPFNGVTDLPKLYSDVDIIYAGYRPNSNTRECAEVVKFFECIVTGTPIILTSAYTGMATRISKFGFGLTCDTRDVLSVRECILHFKNDKSFLKQCSSNEKKEAKNYTWEEAVKILDNIYKEII